jgi:membrane protein implicated in regulation of membrane protease activity
MPGWVIWAIAAVLLGLGELATPGLFFLAPVALAAIPAGIVALLGGAAWLQVLVFILGSLATLAVLRPIARAHLHMPMLTRTGAAALVGTRAVVLERVDAFGGRVRIGGEEWSARAYMD